MAIVCLVMEGVGEIPDYGTGFRQVDSHYWESQGRDPEASILIHS